MLSSEFNNGNSQIIKAYFHFRVLLCILTNILAYVFWENEFELQMCFFLLFFILWMCVNF